MAGNWRSHSRFCATLAWLIMFLVEPAAGQQGALPDDAVAAIRNAVEASRRFAAEADITGSIAAHPAPRAAIQSARRRAGSATVSSAVVDAIASHPASVAAIVRHAVQVAPGEREVIVREATAAFPGFARPIAVGAGFQLPACRPDTIPVAAPAPAAVPKPVAAPSPGGRRTASPTSGWALSIMIPVSSAAKRKTATSTSPRVSDSIPFRDRFSAPSGRPSPTSG